MFSQYGAFMKVLIPAKCGSSPLENVEIVNARFQEIEFKKKFNAIFCIGVFEYSQMFVDAADPYDEILRVYEEFLDDQGILILAIENQFGLKYFSGSKEDHTAVVFDGLEGYPRFPRKARTFGLQELSDRIRQRFSNVRFYYPYPDYKMPECVLSDEFMDIPNVSELIGSYRARDYPGPDRAFIRCPRNKK